MKKTIAILLALIMLLSLAACDRTATDNTVRTTASAGESNSETMEVTDLKGRTVTLPDSSTGSPARQHRACRCDLQSGGISGRYR